MSTIKKFKDFELIVSDDPLTSNEVFEFANIAKKCELFVNGFTLSRILDELISVGETRKADPKNYSSMIRKEHTQSVIVLAKHKGDYVGICAYLPFSWVSMNTFILPQYRKMGLAYKMNSMLLSILKNNGEENEISFHNGESQSLLLFYKLWKNKKITLKQISKEDQYKIKYIDKKKQSVDLDIYTHCNYFSRLEEMFFSNYFNKSQNEHICVQCVKSEQVNE